MSPKRIVAGLSTLVFLLLAVVLILVGPGTDGQPSPVFGAPLQGGSDFSVSRGLSAGNATLQLQGRSVCAQYAATYIDALQGGGGT